MKKGRNLMIFHLIFCLFVLFSACSENVVIQDIILEKSELTVMVGEVRYIKTVILPSNADRAEMKWSSSNPEIVSVNNGEVLGVKEGEAIITISAQSKTATCKVTVTNKGVKIISISFEKNEITITEGESHLLTLTILPENATNKEIVWTSDQEHIVTVDTTGKITAQAVGEAYITATTSDGKKTSCKITVERKGKVTGVTLDKERLSLSIGETKTLIATVHPIDALNKNVIWTSNNQDVATVDNVGKVTAISSGDAIITVTTEDGEKTAICNVSVFAVFRDDFNRANTGLKGIDTPNGVGEGWNITHGQFEIKDQKLNAVQGGTPSHSQAVILYKNAVTKNMNGSFSISVDLSSPQGAWGGVIFNAQNKDTYYIFRLKLGTGNVQFLATTDNGASWSVLASQVVPATTFVSGTDYRIIIYSEEPGKYYAKITNIEETAIYGEFNLSDNKGFNYSDGSAGLWGQANSFMFDNFSLKVK